MRRPTCGSALLLPFLIVLLALPSAAAAAGTRTINFDDRTGASCNFVGSDGPLRDRYAPSFGVTFRGPAPNDGGAILNECANFGVTGHSSPNFLAFNTTVTYTPAQGGGVAGGPETIGFQRPAYSVSVKEGQAGGGTVTVTAFDGSTPVATSVSSSPASSAVATLTVSAARITSVQLSFTGSGIIFDDLSWASAPVAPDDAYSTAANSVLSVPAAQGVLKNDSDADGDALTAQLARGPGNGTLALSPDGSFTYTPTAGFSGTDSFAYRASDGGGRSAEATVSLQVRPLPTLLSSTVSNGWLAFVNFTKVDELVVNGMPARSTIVVRCRTKKKQQQKRACPYKRRTIKLTTARSRVNVRKPFRKKRLPIGTKLSITMTAPGFIGKRFTYTMRKRKKPKLTRLCLPPGGKPGKCV